MSLFDKIDITDRGIDQIDNIRHIFKKMDAYIDRIMLKDIEGTSSRYKREFDICKQKLEEACFYAIKSCCIKNRK